MRLQASPSDISGAAPIPYEIPKAPISINTDKKAAFPPKAQLHTHKAILVVLSDKPIETRQNTASMIGPSP